MRRIPTVLALAATFFALGDLAAQEAGSGAPEDELRTMVTGPTAVDRDREEVRSFLDREDVARIADDHGLDLDRAKEGVRTLNAGEVADLAARIRDADDRPDLAGGDTFVISSTAVIIGLLIIILIIVA